MTKSSLFFLYQSRRIEEFTVELGRANLDIVLSLFFRKLNADFAASRGFFDGTYISRSQSSVALHGSKIPRLHSSRHHPTKEIETQQNRCWDIPAFALGIASRIS